MDQCSIGDFSFFFLFFLHKRLSERGRDPCDIYLNRRIHASRLMETALIVCQLAFLEFFSDLYLFPPHIWPLP